MNSICSDRHSSSSTRKTAECFSSSASRDIDYRVSTERDEVVVEWSWPGDDDGEATGEDGQVAMATTSWGTSTCMKATTPPSSPRQIKRLQVTDSARSVDGRPALGLPYGS